MSDFVIRTIRNGQVKVDGKIYKPDDVWLKYDGRFDGQRFAFGKYKTGVNGFEPYIAMWGTEALFKCNDAEYEILSKAHISDGSVNGTLPWSVWRMI